MFRFLVAFSVVALFTGAAPAWADFAMAYYGAALRGDLSGVENGLAQEAESENDRALLEQFNARFIARTNGLDLGALDDPLVKAAAVLYQNYWIEALVNPSARETAETSLTAGIGDILRQYENETANLNGDAAQDHLKAAIEARGYHLILGRTAPLLEFMVWRENELNSYDVELTDGIQPVKVYFMTGFVARGWTDFATFGRASTGGWATSDGLYAVADSYDQTSEKFAISYLKHEGRHFADYALFPKLASADLEYRAKLTELAFAEETVYDLLGHFTGGAARVEDAPHSLANWYVVEGLSKALLGGQWPENPDAWKTIKAGQIHAAARKLLDQHTMALTEDGAETTVGILHP